MNVDRLRFQPFSLSAFQLCFVTSVVRRPASRGTVCFTRLRAHRVAAPPLYATVVGSLSSVLAYTLMCGIAAIFAYHSGAPSVNEGELVAIRDHMTARGPDGAGLWLDPTHRIGLGHRRLSIIDLSDAGAQPMHLPERQLAIVFNGEIYNYRELRARLISQGHVFQSTSDTEVLLHLDEWIPGLSDYFPGEHTLGDLYRRSLAISCHGPR